MIKKLIALVFVSFFVMSGLTVLTENNQNYNIYENNINSFTLTSNNTFNFSINKTIVYSKGISSGGQTFGCYDNSLYYINGSAIYQFNVLNQKTTNFQDLSTQAYQLEIYNNYMIIGYGSGNTGADSTQINIYNFSNNKFSIFYLPNYYYYMQFSINSTGMYINAIDPTNFYTYSYNINSNIVNLVKTGSTLSVGNQLSVSADNNSLIFAINTANTNYLYQYAFINTISYSGSYSTDNTNEVFGNVYDIMDLGNCGLLGSQSYYINNKSAGTTSYSYNPYSTTNLYFSDSNYKNYFVPFSLSGLTFTKLSTYNTNYQEFYYKNNISYVYLPIGNGNNIFNSQSYIINGNHNLYIVNNNNLYVYSYNLKLYNLNVKSYNLENNQIQNYFSLNGIIYTGYSNSFSFTQLPQTLIPLNTSTYYYNGSAITIIQSDFTGSGSNLYYNLSIYYQEIKPASIPLYDIFTYMYPISIIGLFVGMGAFIFTIKKRGYKI